MSNPDILLSVAHEFEQKALIVLVSIAFLCIMGLVDLTTSHHPKYKPIRQKIVVWLKHPFRWHVKPKSLGRMHHDWKPRDGRHLGRAWRNR